MWVVEAADSHKKHSSLILLSLLFFLSTRHFLTAYNLCYYYCNYNFKLPSSLRYYVTICYKIFLYDIVSSCLQLSSYATSLLQIKFHLTSTTKNISTEILWWKIKIRFLKKWERGKYMLLMMMYLYKWSCLSFHTLSILCMCLLYVYVHHLSIVEIFLCLFTCICVCLHLNICVFSNSCPDLYVSLGQAMRAKRPIISSL